MPALADRVGLALRDLYDRVCFADDAAAMVTSDAEITTQSRPSYRLPGAGWFRFLADRQDRPEELTLLLAAVEVFHRVEDPRGEANLMGWPAPPGHPW